MSSIYRTKDGFCNRLSGIICLVSCSKRQSQPAQPKASDTKQAQPNFTSFLRPPSSSAASGVNRETVQRCVPTGDERRNRRADPRGRVTAFILLLARRGMLSSSFRLFWGFLCHQIHLSWTSWFSTSAFPSLPAIICIPFPACRCRSLLLTFASAHTRFLDSQSPHFPPDPRRCQSRR